MLFQSHIYASFVLVLFSFAVLKVSALNYASVNSGDGRFMLQWTYNNSMLMFKLKCKTTGWCGVGFTTTADGKGMVNYDVAVGGVDSANMQYLEDYQSTAIGTPPPDPTPDYKLINANEEGGYTNVEFYRNATTADNKDVQFMNDTKVWIVWAMHSSSDVFGNHGYGNRRIVPLQHNLIMEAMSALIQPSATTTEPSATMMQSSASTIEPSATMMQSSASTIEPSATMMQSSASTIEPSATMMQPSSTIIEPSATMMQPSSTITEPSATMIDQEPSTTIMQPSSSGPTPTSKNAGSDTRSHDIVTYAILPLAICALHF